jgi:hypothetical protein
MGESVTMRKHALSAKRYWGPVTTCLLSLVIAFALTGCTATLTSQEKIDVIQLSIDIARADQLDAQIALSGYSAETDASTANADLDKSADRVIAIAREKPDAVFSSDDGSRTMRQVLGDTAAKLSTNHAAVSKRLELAVETLPK